MKGRGVFAIEKINKGEIIEECELILLDLKKLQEDLEGYVYQYSKDKVAVALGNGSLYNHSDQYNCDFYFNYKRRKLYFRARKSIQPGEEITINYRYDPSSKKRFNIV